MMMMIVKGFFFFPLDSEHLFTYIRHMSVSIQTAIGKFRKFYKDNKRGPTYEEVAALFNFASKNAAHKLVGKLVDGGILEKDSNGKIIPKNLFAIPYFGLIKAGYPMPAENLPPDTLDLYSFIFNMPGNIFCLSVRGDSMIDEGIRDGDMVIVEKGREVRNGDIVAANVDGEWTVKYFQRKMGKVVLLPANDNYPPIYPMQSLEIGGVVIHVIRSYVKVRG